MIAVLEKIPEKDKINVNRIDGFIRNTANRKRSNGLISFSNKQLMGVL